MNIFLCGGGTAGHITPALALYDTFKEQGHEPRLIISEKDISIIPQGYDYSTLKLTAPGNITKNILFIFRFAFSLVDGFTLISRYKPQVILGMGGFVSFPMLILALLRKIEIFLCDQNSVPGKVNKLFYNKAKMVYLSFSKSLEFMPKGKVFGNPVRREFYITNRDVARITLGIGKSDKVLIVMGGSQGSLKLNNLFFSVINKLNAGVENLHIFWLCGSKWYKDMQSKISKIKLSNVHIFSYYKDIPSLLSAGDFALSRAGSSSIAELMVIGLPSLLVPFPYATDNHQYYNAREMLHKDMAYLIKESLLDSDRLANILISNLNDQNRLNTMKENILIAEANKADVFIVNDIINEMSEKTGS